MVNINVLKAVLSNNKIKERDNWTCQYCGCRNRLILTIDHRIPKIRNGDDSDKNKVTCCYICNQLKGGLTEKEFKKYLKQLYSLGDITKIKLEIHPPILKFFPAFYPQTDDKTMELKLQNENNIKGNNKEVKSFVKTNPVALIPGISNKIPEINKRDEEKCAKL